VRVALTFDTEFPDRPSPTGVEEQILSALAGAGVRATFFLQGRWARAYPEVARRIAEPGHVIGNHSHHHAPMDGLLDDFFRSDVVDAQERILAATGVDPRPLFRCPFGSGMDDSRVLGLLDELGYRHVGWDVDPRDWEEGREPTELLTRVRAGVRERDEAIVLLHGWPRVTGEALPGMLDALAAAGAEFVTVEELEDSRRRARRNIR
jgi:peptidoglycan/xylan/chitin deacetylase (PgdA/CDA1 family)